MWKNNIAFVAILLVIYALVFVMPRVGELEEVKDGFSSFWPLIKQNECIPGKTTCCNQLKYDSGLWTCYGVSVWHNPDMFKGRGCDYEKSKNKKEKCYERRAKKIMRENYFTRPGIFKLPQKYQWPVTDFAIHAGPKRAITVLQRAVGANPDGIIGPQTIKRVRTSRLDPSRYNQLRAEWLRSLRIYKKYPKGIENRISKVESQTREISKGLTKNEKSSCQEKLDSLEKRLLRFKKRIQGLLHELG